MKNLIVLICLLCSMPALADFFSVKAKSCDQKPVTAQNGERVFLDLNQLIVGIGYTDSQSCRIVDFKSVVIQSSSSAETIVAAVSSVGRRSSCTSGVTAYAGPEFSTATIHSNSLEINGLKGSCTSVTYQF